MGGKGGMTTTPISLQDLRRSLYVKAKTEPTWRFWGLYVHVCKMETLQEAYRMAKSNDGAPGIDGVTFDAIEESGTESFLTQIRNELVANTYRPMRARKKEIPKDGGTKVRVLSIPAIRDRVVQGALKLILEPIFEADFQAGSYGYRPKRTAHEAIDRVAKAIAEEKTRIIDLDLKAYFDNVQHYLLLEKVARRVQDDAVMHLLKMILKATGKKGVPQGGVISPLLSNLYLTEVDRMLERAIATTRNGKFTHVQYARFADDGAPRAQRASALARNDPTLLTEPDPGNPPAAGMISLSLPSTCGRRAGFVRWVTLFEQKWVILAERRGACHSSTRS